MDKPMTHKHDRHSSLTPLRRWAAAFCLVAGTLLSSCGGQSSGTVNTVGGGDSQNSGGNSNTASLAMAGAYKGTATGNSSEFVSFVTPGQQLYVLYALQASDPNVYPIVYTGSIQSAGATTATVAALKSFQYQNNLRSGTATISGTSAAAHTMALSSLYIPTLNTSPQFTAAAMATTNNAQGVWVGTWADGLDGSIRTNTNLSVSLSGTSFTAQTGFGNCTSLALTLTPASDSPANPYFTAQVDITAATGCLRNPAPSYTPTTLRGIGFIHAPSTGVKRLELILTDTSGSGISFRGDQ